MVPTTKEQQTALDILRTSNSIATPEQLAAVIRNPEVPRYCQLTEGERRRWLGQQINGLNYLAHSTRITNEVDLTIEAAMSDQAIMDDAGIRALTQVEMQEAFRRGIAREYGDFYGITASSIVSFLKGFLRSEKRQVAKAIIKADEEKERKAGDERFWKALVEHEKKVGNFIPTWGPKHNFKESEK